MATSLETFGSLNIEWNESTTRAITECRDALTMLDELQGEFDDLNNPDGAADVLPALRLTRETVARHLREHNELEERIAELELHCTSVDKLLALQVARHHEAIYLEQQSNLLLARQQYVAKYAKIPVVNNTLPDVVTTLPPTPDTTSSSPSIGLNTVRVACPHGMPSFKDGDENAEEFLAEFESILIANNLTPDEHWKRLLVACMKVWYPAYADTTLI